MKKRILSAALALCLCLGLAVPAWAAGPTFTDVPANHWAYDAIEDMSGRGVVSGYGNGKFGPNDNVTPAQFSIMLSRLFYNDELNAMPAGYSWWVSAANLLMNKGVFENTTAGVNCEKGIWDDDIMNAPMNRYDMAQMMYGVLKAKGVELPGESELAATAERIADYKDIPSRYVDAVTAMYTIGCLAGVDNVGNFKGTNLMNRAQACVVLVRLMEKVDGSKTPVPPEKPVETEDSGTFQFDAPFDKPYTMQVGDQSRMMAHYYLGGERWGTVVGQVYTSSDPNVVRVVSGDEIKAVGPGKATVTCSAYWFDLPVTTSCQITVEAEQEITEPTEPDEPTVPDEPLTENDLHELREEMLELVNTERANVGLPALRLNDEVCAYAQIRASEVSSNFSHTRPNGENFWTELGRLGIEYYPGGENISAGSNDPADTVARWMDSPGHRANILKEGIGQIGIGFVEVDSGYRYYWVQVFVP